MTPMTTPTTPADVFQSRDEIVQFIEQQAAAAVEKAAPAAGPQKPERRTPWVTAGPVGRDSAGYSVLKAAAFALGYAPADQAKEEIETHKQLRDLYAGYGFTPTHGAQSFLVPLASAHLPAFDPHGRRLQAELRQKMTAHAGKFDPDEADWITRRAGGGFGRKALTLAGDADGFVQAPVLGELIDLQRNLEAFAAAGATEIALPPAGRLLFPKVTGSATAYWVGEGAPIADSQPTTGNLELVAKKLGVLVKLNNELLRFASPSAEGLVRFDMARAAAVKADLAMFEGAGGTQIKGLLTYPDIKPHTAAGAGPNGDTLSPADIAAMEAKLPDAVDAPTAWVMRKGLFAALMNRRAEGAAGDDGGAFLFRPAGGAAPRELYGTKVVRSAQVSAARTKGANAALTYLLLGYFPDWVVGRMGVMEFLASGYGDTALAADMTYLRGVQHIDAGPRHAGSFVVCDQLLTA